MGNRLLEDDEGERDPSDPDAPAVLPRNKKTGALKKLAREAPKASSSLDDFISKAHDNLLEVRSDATPIPTSGREKDLQARIDELEKKLKAAEARANSAADSRDDWGAPEPELRRKSSSTSWGGIAVAFALGCGAMFAVSTFVLKNPPETSAATTPAPEATNIAAPDPAPAPTPPAPAPTEVAQPTQVAAPTRVAPTETPPAPTPAPTEVAQPTPTEVAQPTPTPTDVATPTPTPTPTPTQTTPTPTAAPVPDKVAAKKPPAGAHHAASTQETHAAATTNTTTNATTTTTTTQPPPPNPPDGAQNGSSDLYNPF